MSYWPSLWLIRGFAETKAKDALEILKDVPHKNFCLDYAENSAADVFVYLRHKNVHEPYYIKFIEFKIRWATHWEDVEDMLNCIKEAKNFWMELYTANKIAPEEMPPNDLDSAPNGDERWLRHITVYGKQKAAILLDKLNEVSDVKFDVEVNRTLYGCNCQFSCPAENEIMRVGYNFVISWKIEVDGMMQYMDNVIKRIKNIE